MKARVLAICLAVVAVSLALLPAGHAVPATGFTLDKSSYSPGDSGKATITFYNDQGRLIRITGVDMLFSYFYQDGRVYSQDFLSPVLSMNVTDATVSAPVVVQFSLPSTVAAGYITPTITVTFNALGGGGSFGGPNQDTSRAPSPVQIVIASSQTMTYVLAVTTVLFGALTIYFALRYFSSQASTSRKRMDQQA